MVFPWLSTVLSVKYPGPGRVVQRRIEEGGLSAPLSRFAAGKTLPPEDIFRQKNKVIFCL